MGCGGSTEPDTVDTGMQFASFPQYRNPQLIQQNSPIPELISLSRETLNSNIRTAAETGEQQCKSDDSRKSEEDSVSWRSSSDIKEPDFEETQASSQTNDEVEVVSEKHANNYQSDEQHEVAKTPESQEGHFLTRPTAKASIPIKVYSADRQIRKLMAVTSYQDLLNKCRDRLEHNDNTILKIVLYEDGMEVDEESYDFLPANSNVMVLADGEEWMMEGMKVKHDTERTLPEEVSQELGLLKQMLSRRPKARKNDVETTVLTSEHSEPSFVEEASCVSVAPRKRSSNRTLPTAESGLVNVSPGWKDFSKLNKVYYQVKSSKFHKLPTGDITMSSGATYDDVINQMQNLYFPRGKNFRGQLSTYETCLGNGKSKLVSKESFSFRNFMKDPCTQKMKIFLMTKKKEAKKVKKSSSQNTEVYYTSEETTASTSEVQHQFSCNSPIQSQTTCSSIRSSTASSIPSRHEQITQTTPIPNSRQSTSARSATSLALQNNRKTSTTSQSGLNSPMSRQLDRQPTPVPNTNHQEMSGDRIGPSSAKSSRTIIQAEHTAAQQESSVRRCPICADAESDAVIIPCMHALCYLCGLYLMSYGLPCHMCRGTIFQVKSIHYN